MASGSRARCHRASSMGPPADDGARIISFGARPAEGGERQYYTASMRITDVSITLHRWDVPPTTYRDAFGGGSTNVGVVTIATDDDVAGYSFLGSASAGAEQFASQVLTRLK